mgnify:CR=1 FL=1
MASNPERAAFDPDHAYRQMVEAGEAWADAEAAAQALEESRKSVLASLMVGQAAPSLGAKEMHALADEQYRGHVEAMVKARKAANLARVRYDCRKVLAEMRRTQESTRRAEMNIR